MLCPLAKPIKPVYDFHWYGKLLILKGSVVIPEAKQVVTEYIIP